MATFFTNIDKSTSSVAAVKSKIIKMRVRKRTTEQKPVFEKFGVVDLRSGIRSVHSQEQQGDVGINVKLCMDIFHVPAIEAGKVRTTSGGSSGHFQMV
jgi:hypothetical protein